LHVIGRSFGREQATMVADYLEYECKGRIVWAFPITTRNTFE
jgi:hypothetical protein